MRSPPAPDGRRPRILLSDLMAAGPVVLDGAMGTELGARGVDTTSGLWSALALTEAPEAIAAVHADYLTAGARVICTNSYQAVVPALLRAGRTEDEARAVIAASARLALGARDRYTAVQPREAVLVAGSIGPYGAWLADGSEYTGAYGMRAPDFARVHLPRLEVLAAEGGLSRYEYNGSNQMVRMISPARIGERLPDAECWVSFQVRPDGAHLADGTPLARAAAWAQRARNVVAVGLNCVAPPVVDRALPVLRAAADKPLVAYPNSGDVYDPVTRTWRATVGRGRLTASTSAWLDAGVRLIGGCCRTTPADTAELRDAVRSTARPR